MLHQFFSLICYFRHLITSLATFNINVVLEPRGGAILWSLFFFFQTVFHELCRASGISLKPVSWKTLIAGWRC